MNITEHIKNNEEELNNSLASPQRKRHLQSELEDLIFYQKNHPDEDKDPSALELYCDQNPHEPECKIFNL